MLVLFALRNSGIKSFPGLFMVQTSIYRLIPCQHFIEIDAAISGEKVEDE